MKLLQRIKVLEATIANNNSLINGSLNTSELQSKCNVLLKERDAVCTIMEQKIKVLVNNISQALSLVLQNDMYSKHINDGAGNALSKDVATLQRLVHASVVALKATTPGTPSPSGNTTPNSNSNLNSSVLPVKNAVTSHTISVNNNNNNLQQQLKIPPSNFSYNNNNNTAILLNQNLHPNQSLNSNFQTFQNQNQNQPLRKPPPPPPMLNNNIYH